MTAADAAAPRGPDGPATAASDSRLAAVVREESGRIVASLTAWIGSFDIAEEAVAEAVVEALRSWRARGIPPSPGGWLTQAARHNALDRMRRESRYREKLALLVPGSEAGFDAGSAAASGEDDADERLPLLFGCCHPALSADAQLALTLRAVCGLTTAQIARATFSTESTVAQRIVRAKRKIGAAGIPIRVPGPAERPARLDIVLTVVSVMYSEAHLVAGGDASADRDLAEDALWLARVIAVALPREAEAQGLLSLLLFHRARESARAGRRGACRRPAGHRADRQRGGAAADRRAAQRGCLGSAGARIRRRAVTAQLRSVVRESSSRRGRGSTRGAPVRTRSPARAAHTHRPRLGRRRRPRHRLP